MINPFVILIAGPTGVGKTTLSKMINQHYNYTYLSEDETAKIFYPDTYQNIEDSPDEMRIVASQILKEATEISKCGKGVVIDMINLDKNLIEEIQEIFRDHLVLRILLPPIETIIERDKNRAGWTSGESTIRKFYNIYEELIPVIGQKNYLNNSHQTPHETLEQLITSIEHDK